MLLFLLVMLVVAMMVTLAQVGEVGVQAHTGTQEAVATMVVEAASLRADDRPARVNPC